jgi:hypothetical protein
MDKITRTAYGSELQTCLFFRIPYKWRAFTTLNELLGINAGVYPPADMYPAARYYAIGNKGHGFEAGAGGMIALKTYQHLATNSGPFGPLPFVMREPNNDLSPAERARYGLRKELIVSGVRWIAYYLKRIVMDNVTSELLYKTVKEDGTVTTTPFVPTNADLHPQPQELQPAGVNVTSGDYVAAQALVPLGFNRADTDELKNVANILYGSTNLAQFSEIAIVSAVDKRVDVTGEGGGSFTFMEAIGCQIATFLSTYFHANTNNDGMTLILNAGATEPLFKVENAVINAFGAGVGISVLQG